MPASKTRSNSLTLAPPAGRRLSSALANWTRLTVSATSPRRGRTAATRSSSRSRQRARTIRSGRPPRESGTYSTALPASRWRTSSSQRRTSAASPRIAAANKAAAAVRSEAAVTRGFARLSSSQADTAHSVSSARTAASISRSAAASRCHRNLSNSPTDIPGGGSTSRPTTARAARTIVRLSRRIECRQPAAASTSARVAGSATRPHHAVTAA